MQTATTIERTSVLERIKLDISGLLLAFIVLGSLGIIYLVGVEPLQAVHDATHDVRHTTGFPCH